MNRKRGLVPIGVLALVGLLLLMPSLCAARPQDLPTDAGRSLAATNVTAATQYDSGWTAVAQGACHTFAHNLGGNPNDYAVEHRYRWHSNALLSLSHNDIAFRGERSESAATRG